MLSSVEKLYWIILIMTVFMAVKCCICETVSQLSNAKNITVCCKYYYYIIATLSVNFLC